MTDLTRAMLEAVKDGTADQARTPYSGEILLSGAVCKLGAQVRTWRERYCAVFGDHVLRYYKTSPTLGTNLRDMKPQGEIHLQRDVVEILSKANSSAYMAQERSLLQNIDWPPQASDHNAFGIRTTRRVFYMFSVEATAESWINKLDRLCHGGEAYLGIDATVPPPSKSPSRSGSLRRASSVDHSSNASSNASRTPSRRASQPASRNSSRTDSPHRSHQQPPQRLPSTSAQSTS